MNDLRLLDSQVGFYYGSKINDNESIYNISEYVEIIHSVDLTKLKQSIKFVISQNPTLRVFITEENGIPSLHMFNHDVFIEVIDLSLHSDSKDLAIALMNIDAKHPFSLDTGPLFRNKLIKISDEHFLWYFCSHHLLLDGYSTYLFIHQVAECYRHLLKSQKNEEIITYEQLLKVQDDYKSSSIYFSDKEFWRNNISPPEPPTTLISSNLPSGHIIRHVSSIPCPNDLFGLKDSKSSWILRTLASIFAYLYLCTGIKMQTIGVPMMNRTNQITRQALTSMTNILPLTIEIDEQTISHQLVDQIEQKLALLKRHQALRYEEIKNLRSKEIQSPLFNIIVNTIPFEMEVFFSNQEYSVIKNLASGGAHDLVFNIRPDCKNGALRLEIDADSGLYDEGILFQHCKGIQDICNLLFSESQMLSIPDLRKVLSLSLQGQVSGHENVIDIIARIEHITTSLPGSKAICTPEHIYPALRTVSYAFLQQQAIELANTINLIRSANTTLILHLPQGPEAIICMLAALKLKIPFTNLNVKNVDNERTMLLENFGNVILISDVILSCDSFQLGLDLITPCISNDLSHLFFYRKKVEENTNELQIDTGYIMFTSGSTGLSKGVMCSRLSLSTFIDSAIKCYNIQPTDRVLQFAPLHFDACIEEIFMSLATGACLYIASETTKYDFRDFLSFCDFNSINILDLPTAYFNEMLFALSQNLVLPSTIKTIIIGGENLTQQTKERWFNYNYNSCRLFNSYGPTETTVIATAAEVKNNDELITIGTPINNVITIIVGENLLPLPIGCSGELLIAGPTVCLGYFKQPDLSEERFITIDINGIPTSAYRTGDIVYQRHDGNLIFLGRKTREVKVFGQRVNINEIEGLISKLTDIIEIAVVSRNNSTGIELSAHYHASYPLDETTRRTLYGKLPNSHIPQHFEYHQAPLPKLANGKIDYRTLEKLTLTSELNKKASSKTFEMLVQELWVSTLGSDVGDFYSLGGESLQAIKMVNTLNAYCKLDINIGDIFKNPTLSQFYQFIIQLAHSRYRLSLQSLDIRCAISQSLSSCSPKNTTLFVQNPHGLDEQKLLVALSNIKNINVITTYEQLYAFEEQSIDVAVLNIPDAPSSYVFWLENLLSLLHVLFGRVHQIIILHNIETGNRFKQEILYGYQHEKLSLIYKNNWLKDDYINEALSELISLSVQVGYFPQIYFDTANENLTGRVLNHFDITDTHYLNNDKVFTIAQKKNPGLQVCSLSDWLNLISTFCSKNIYKNRCLNHLNNVDTEGNFE